MLEPTKDAHGELRGVVGVGDGKRLPAFLTIYHFHAQIPTVLKGHRNRIPSRHVPQTDLDGRRGGEG